MEHGFMRKMKGSGSYLKNQVRKNLAKAAFCLFLFCLIVFILGLSVVYSFSVSVLDVAGLLVSLSAVSCILLLPSQIPNLQRRLGRRKTSHQTAKQ